jgi:ABC-type glycerol-3-phosphate transport system substrate-binding protein
MGCGPSGATDVVSPNNQAIILWHSAEGDVRRTLLTQIDAFNATNPWGILIVPEYHGEPAQMMNELLDAIQAQRAPELVLGMPRDALRLGDAVVPFERYVVDPQYGLSDADLIDLYDAPINANRDPNRDRRIIGFPIAAEGSVLVYNADRLAVLGYLTPPTSWALFREVCLVATTDSNGDRRPDVFGFGFAPRPEFVAAWFLSRGAPLLVDSGDGTGLDNEDGLNMLELLGEMSNAGCFFPTPGRGADIDAFSSGRAAMIFANTSDLREIDHAVEAAGGFRWGVTPVPYGRRDTTLDVTGLAWIMMQSTAEKQLAAWFFARWFAGTEQTLAWAQGTGQLPLRQSAVDQLRQLNADAPHYNAALDLLAHGQADPLVSNWPDVAEAATRAVLSVAAGDDPRATHAQTVTTINGLSAP